MLLLTPSPLHPPDCKTPGALNSLDRKPGPCPLPPAPDGWPWSVWPCPACGSSGLSGVLQFQAGQQWSEFGRTGTSVCWRRLQGPFRKWESRADVGACAVPHVLLPKLPLEGRTELRSHPRPALSPAGSPSRQVRNGARHGVEGQEWEHFSDVKGPFESVVSLCPLPVFRSSVPQFVGVPRRLGVSVHLRCTVQILSPGFSVVSDFAVSCVQNFISWTIFVNFPLSPGRKLSPTSG